MRFKQGPRADDTRQHPQPAGRTCDAPIDRWRVVTLHGNYSAFNGRRFTPSAYSACRCLRCGWYWRTKAAYVGRMATDAECTGLAENDQWP